MTLSTGDPANHGFTGTVNYKTDQFNLFTTQGYSYRKGPGNSMTDTEYLDQDSGETTGFLEERRNNERLNKSYNGNFGIDLFLDKSTTWTNTFLIEEVQAKIQIMFYNVTLMNLKVLNL